MLPPAITQADLAALAALANSKLLPANSYLFPPFAGQDKIGMPAEVSPVTAYGPAGHWGDGSKVTLKLFAYKTIAGVKTYTWAPLLKAFVGQAGAGAFALTWTWSSATGPTAPEGYLVVIPQRVAGSSPPGWQYLWRDLGNVPTFTEDGSFTNPAWRVDASLGQNLTVGGPVTSQDLPCDHGAWLKTLNAIRLDLFLRTDICTLNAGDVSAMGGFGADSTDYFPASEPVTAITTLGQAALVSGPWIVSAQSSQLTCWRARDYNYFPSPATGPGLVGGSTQCYAGVKFYFRAADAPAGINITAQNQLLAFTVGSDPVPVFTHTLHFPLIVVGCSDGHLKISDAGGGTVRFEADMVAGNTYDASFDLTDPAGYNPQGSYGRPLDFIFTSAGTAAAVAAPGLELNNDIQCATVPDSYFEMQFLNVQANGVGAYLCTSAGQLVLTENNHVPGLWAARTLPTMGEMPYLDVDLPQYLSAAAGVAGLTTRRVPMNPALPYIAIVDNRGALWPVFRDTDFTPDSVAGKALRGSAPWQLLGTKYVRTNSFTDDIPPYEPAEQLFNYSLFVPAGAADVRFLAADPAVTLYVKAGGFPTVADHDAAVPGGTWLSLAEMLPGFATGTFWFYSLGNPTGADLPVTSTTVILENPAPPNGTFFPTQKDDAGQPFGQPEPYSYRFADPGASDARPVPLSGYCIYSITARRQAIPNAAGVAVAPAAGTAALPVKIGVMLGYGFETKGVFTEIITVTIPAGQSSVTVPVFWPVLSGTPLAYQGAELVFVRARVNFQPMMHSHFNPTTSPVNGVPQVVGYYNGAPFLDKDKALLFFQGGVIFNPIELPISAVVYNDLTAVLNLL